MISIIIPAYNYEKFLPFSIESALAQATPEYPVEVVVVDDGSTDHTQDVLRTYGQAIRVIHQDNQGLSAARNTGMREARGRYFTFLDADDLLCPGVLASQRQALTARNADIAVCLNEEMRGLGEAGPFWRVNIWQLLQGNFPVHLCLHNIAPPHALMIDRAFAERVGVFDMGLRACEDHDFWLRCAVAGARFTVNPRGLVLYRKHASSMSANKRNQLAHDALLHERVRNTLVAALDFVGDMVPEAWMAHAAGCLRTTINLLAQTDQAWREQDIALALNLIDLACQAIRQTAKTLSSSRVAAKRLADGNATLPFYVLSVLQHLRPLTSANHPALNTARDTLSRLFPQWSQPDSRIDALCVDFWQRLVVPQQPQDLNTLVAPILAAAKARSAERVTTVQRPRVLLGSDFFWPSTGGCEQFMEGLGLQLLGAGYDVYVATRHMDERPSRKHEGLRIIPFACAGRFRDSYFGNDFGQYKTFLREIPFHARIFLVQPDAWLTAPLLEGPLPGKTFLIPVINPELMEDWNRLEEVGLVAHTLRNATTCLALTQSGLDRRFMESIGLTPTFLPHAIREYPPNPGFRERHGLGDDPLLVLVANLWPVKNHLALVRVLRDTPGTWRLALIGNSLPWPDERRYAEEVCALAAADPRMTFLGGLPPEEADAAIAAADILLLPSKAECRPLVLLQAMRHGTPWIATPQCNSAHDDAGGLVCPVERFGEAVTACLANPAARKVLGELGQTHWRKCFRWEIILPCFIELMAQGRITTDLTMQAGLRIANARLQRKLLGPIP